MIRELENLPIPKLSEVFVFGVVSVFIWHIGVFIGSMVGSSELPNLHGSLVASLVIIGLTKFNIKSISKYIIRSQINPVILSLCNLLFVLIVIVIISIPNGTTRDFFGNWHVYLTFLSIGFGTYIGLKTQK